MMDTFGSEGQFAKRNPKYLYDMNITAGIILLYCVATVVAITTQRIRIPYTAGLLLAGVALGATHVVALPHLTKELLFAIFLPGLLFEAAYHLEVHELRENAFAIGTLAVPGSWPPSRSRRSSLSRVRTARRWCSRGMDDRSDLRRSDRGDRSVAVTALFRQVAAPRRLHVLVESESLLNDGTSIVFLTLMLAYFSGEAPTAIRLVIGFVRIAGGGTIIGLVIGWGISHIRTRLDDAAIEITLTTIAAYGAFVLAEQIHCSGVIATVAAGVVCGHTGRHHAMTANTRAAVDGFWEWLAFALNSAVFLLLGAELQLDALAGNGGSCCSASSPSSVRARSSWRSSHCFSAARATNARHLERCSRVGRASRRAVLGAGARASCEIENRSLIVALTAGTVMVSLVGQGMTMSMLLRRLHPRREWRNPSAGVGGDRVKSGRTPVDRSLVRRHPRMSEMKRCVRGIRRLRNVSDQPSLLLTIRDGDIRLLRS